MKLLALLLSLAQQPDPACVLRFNKSADSAAKTHVGSTRLTAYQKRALARIDSMARVHCPDAIPPTPEPPDSQPPAPTPAPSGDLQKILALIGPTKTVTETSAMGSAFARYDTLFKVYLPSTDASLCDGVTVLWCNNYYDRGVVHYARYARTGDTTFKTRATAIVLDYRKKYLEPNGYASSPHWSQVRGLELHYRLTGDTLSRRAVAGVFMNSLVGYMLPLWGDPKIPDLQNTKSDYMENRIQARVLQAALSSYRMGASYVRGDGYGGAFTPATHPARLRTILDQILSVQKSDGSFSWVQICGGQLNYMVGMLNDVLIEYYRDFEPDPRIPVAVERANEFLWSTQWLAADGAFKYASVLCAPNPFGTMVGGPEPAGDLNGLFIASFGWLYQRTGDTKWRTRGDAILAGLVASRWASNYTGSKQFNQAFAESYRYLGWR